MVTIFGYGGHFRLCVIYGGKGSVAPARYFAPAASEDTTGRGRSRIAARSAQCQPSEVEIASVARLL
jgi:hypothetical protein